MTKCIRDGCHNNARKLVSIPGDDYCSLRCALMDGQTIEENIYERKKP